MKDFTTERLNFDVALYKGCTLNEIIQLGFLSVMLGLVIFIPITLSLFQSFLWGLIPTLLISPLITKVLISRLQVLKRDKPHAYYQHYLQLKSHKFGFHTPYLQRSGIWSTERHL